MPGVFRLAKKNPGRGPGLFVEVTIPQSGENSMVLLHENQVISYGRLAFNLASQKNGWKQGILLATHFTRQSCATQIYVAGTGMEFATLLGDLHGTGLSTPASARVVIDRCSD